MIYYALFINDTLIYKTGGDPVIFDVVLKQSVNKAGNLSFSIPASLGINVSLGDLVRLDCDTYVVGYGMKNLFYGYVVKATECNDVIQVSVNGMMDYLDSVVYYRGGSGETPITLDGLFNLLLQQKEQNGSGIYSIRGVNNSFPKGVKLEIYFVNTNYSHLLKMKVYGTNRTSFTAAEFDALPMINKSSGVRGIKNANVVNGSPYKSYHIFAFRFVADSTATVSEDELIPLTFAPFEKPSINEGDLAQRYLANHGSTDYISCNTSYTNDFVESSYGYDDYINGGYIEPSLNHPDTSYLQLGKLYMFVVNGGEYLAWKELYLNDTNKAAKKLYNKTQIYDSFIDFIKSETLERLGGTLRVGYSTMVSGKMLIEYRDADNILQCSQNAEYGVNIIADTLKTEYSGEIYGSVIPMSSNDSQDVPISFINTTSGADERFGTITYQPLADKYSTLRKKKLVIDVKDKTKSDIADEIYSYLVEMNNNDSVITFDAIDRTCDGSLAFANRFTVGCKTKAILKNGEERTVYCVGATIHPLSPEKNRYKFSTVLESNNKISNASLGGKSSIEKQKDRRDGVWYTVGISSSVIGHHNTDTLRYMRQNDRVYLQGKIQTYSGYKHGSTAEIIATLPQGYRPKQTRYLMMACSGRYIARCGCNASGKLFLDYIINHTADGAYVDGAVSWIDFTFSFDINK